jgi:selenide,water dikinase
LAQALAILPRPKDEKLLVGVNTADDAGVYRISDDRAIVYTIDIFTPTVPDAYEFGQIAAANSISDVYAMGGEPFLALNITGFPNNEDPEVLGRMLLGGQEKASEAGVTIIGGHTFATKEIKYGLSVVGFIHPDRIISNAGAKPGDVIVLTKPLGVGTMIQASMLDLSIELDLAPVIESMKTLNREASLAMRQAGAHAATDITGYGLLGHLVELAEASRVGIELSASVLPVFEGALEIIAQGVLEPGIAMNTASFGERVEMRGVDPHLSQLMFGSETSGGLAVVLPESHLDRFRKKFTSFSPVIGRITRENPGRIFVFDKLGLEMGS